MNGEAERSIEVPLAGGRRITLRLIGEHIHVEVERAEILVVSRNEAWTIAEALDALATSP